MRLCSDYPTACRCGGGGVDVLHVAPRKGNDEQGDGVGTIRRNQQVYVVVGHQGVGVKRAMFFFKGFAQPGKIGLIICFAKEAGFTVMSPLHHMQWHAIKMSAGATGHAAILARLIEPGPFNLESKCPREQSVGGVDESSV